MICEEIKVNTFRDVLLVVVREKKRQLQAIKLIFSTIDETQKEKKIDATMITFDD